MPSTTQVKPVHVPFQPCLLLTRFRRAGKLFVEHPAMLQLYRDMGLPEAHIASAVRVPGVSDGCCLVVCSHSVRDLLHQRRCAPHVIMIASVPLSV